MSRFNGSAPTGRQTRPTSPVQTTGQVTQTFEGGKAFVKDARGELFQLAVVNMVGHDTFYESGDDRDSRYIQLIRQLAVSDPEWTYNLLKWLRGPEGNLRTASLVGAAEFVKARIGDNVISTVEPGAAGWNRRVINAVLQRADEPGELLGYWTGKYGKPIPQPIKRGIVDALKRLYDERGYLRYDGDSKDFRFADVIELVHPKGVAPWQGDLFRHAINVRHKRNDAPMTSLPAVTARATINAMTPHHRHEMARLAIRDGLPNSIYDRAMAGQWEWLHSILGDTTGAKRPLSKADQWRLVLPQLGYMALLRNLRNLEEAGLTPAEMRKVSERLADPAQVAKSRQFPFRFWSAYKNTNGFGFTSALEEALGHSMRNLPSLPGRSLILADVSGSMTRGMFSQKSTMTPLQCAALFAVSLSVKSAGDVDLVGFATNSFRHEVRVGASALRETERFVARANEVGYGTNIVGALSANYQPGVHKRVFIISDMQTMDTSDRYHVNTVVPLSVPVYAFDLGGHAQTLMEVGRNNRHSIGGLSDATFKQVPMLEAGTSVGWPWELSE